MPQIPEEKFRPDICEVLIDILKSIALEETALSHILNAEGEKIQLIVKKIKCDDEDDTIYEIVNCINETDKLLNTILMKEWLLLKKMETVSDIKDMLFGCKKDKCNKSDKHINKCENGLKKDFFDNEWLD